MKVISPLFAVAVTAAIFAPRADATCDPVCSGGDCVVAKTIGAGATWDITAPADAGCALGKYLALDIGGQATDSIAVTFSDGITATSTDAKDGATTTVCKSTFKDVGKDVVALTNVPKSVDATVKCNNPTADCKVTYLPTWTCQTRDTALCPKECSDPTNCKPTLIAAGGNLVLTNPDTCPASKYSYLTSLMVGARDKTAISIAVAATGATTAAATTDTSTTCYSAYGQFPITGELAAQTADAKATVTCADASKTCTVQTYAKWGCDAPKCSTVCGAGCTDAVITTGGNLMLTKPTTICPIGSFAYPKGLTIGGKYAAHNLAVSFNNNFAPKPTASVADCYFSYPDLGTSALTADVEVKVQCKDATKPCTAQYKVDSWECQAKTYTRTAMVGANCKAANDCVNRCGKSYKVNAKGTAGSFVPQLAADCKCTALTATMAADGKTATNADMTATFDATANTLVLDVTTTGAVCKSTYAVNTFTNPFIPRSYIRQSMAPAACVKADDNTYKCDGDVVLTQPATDKITLTQTTPGAGAITCSGTIDAFLSDDAKTAADATTKIVYTPTATGMQVVTTNADASTCTAVYAGRCAKPCVGCTDQAIASGGSFVVKKADDKTCPTGQFAYPKTLLVGGKDLSQVAVTFNNGLKPTPIDSSGDCFFSYGDVVGSSAVTSNVEATVKCKDPTVACTAQVKVGDWGCYSSVDATKTYMRTAMTGAKCGAVSDCVNRCGKSYAVSIKDGVASFLPQLAADCKCATITATVAADLKTATNTDAGLTATFDAAAKTLVFDVTKAGSECKTTYAVGTFTNPFVTRSYIRQSMAPAACVKADDNGYKCDGDLALTQAAIDKITLTQATPGPGAITCSGATDAFLSDNANSATDSTSKIVYTPTATGMQVVTTNADASTCTAVYAGRCAKPCVGCTDQAIAIGGSFVVKKADDKTCPTGQFAYPKTLLVGGKDLSQVAVTFNNGLKPTLSDSLNDCFFSYTDVVGSSAVTSNVEATVKCKDPAVACTAQVKVGDWGCYGPPDAAKTYTRTAMTGANCVAKLSDCANRCGKSYALGVKDTFTTYVPQLAPDCNCPQLTATPAADAKSAANADTSLTVTYDTTASTMSLAFAKTGAVCTSTYKLAAFTNPFPVKTFTRQNVTPADCVAATDCGYRCDAEIALNKTQVDTVAAVRTAVPSCTCKTTVTYVGDDRKAAGADDTATYLLETTDAGVSVSTTIGAKTCVTAYTEKIVTPAPTTPAPVTTTPAPTAKTGTGTSAGVSALGAGAGAGVTTVTLVAAAAGVQAIGLPV